MSYGPGGNPRGIATIVFVRSDSAQKAAQACKDVKIDGRPMKVRETTVAFSISIS